MDRPTVFLSIFHPFIAKNILNSGVLGYLSEKARVVIFVSDQNRQHYKELYEKQDIVVEGVNIDNFVRSRRNKLFVRLADWLLDTNVMRFHKMEAFEKDHNQIKYYYSLIFTKIFSHITIFKKLIRELDYRLNNPKAFDRFFDKYRPTVIFTTELFNEGDLFLLKNARSRGVKNIAMLRSWDNTTSKGYARFSPDKIIVHNEIMKAEMPKYHDISERIISLSGVPQFEQYLKIKPSSRQDFCKSIGADPIRRFVVFAPAGNYFIDTDWQICQILKDLYYENKIPQDVQFLISLHPFLPVDLSQFKLDENFIIVENGPAKTGDGKIVKFKELDNNFPQHMADLLYNSSVLIGSMSSILIDTVIFDKPLITINFNGWEKNVPFLRSLKRWRLEENQISWMSSGVTPQVYNKEELALWINKYLDDPTLDHGKRIRFRDSYCWKFDGKSAERIASIVLGV